MERCTLGITRTDTTEAEHLGKKFTKSGGYIGETEETEMALGESRSY